MSVLNVGDHRERAGIDGGDPRRLAPTSRKTTFAVGAHGDAFRFMADWARVLSARPTRRRGR